MNLDAATKQSPSNFLMILVVASEQVLYLEMKWSLMRSCKGTAAFNKEFIGIGYNKVSLNISSNTNSLNHLPPHSPINSMNELGRNVHLSFTVKEAQQLSKFLEIARSHTDVKKEWMQMDRFMGRIDADVDTVIDPII